MALKLLTDMEGANPIGDPIKFTSYSWSDSYVRQRAERTAGKYAGQFPDANAYSMSISVRERRAIRPAPWRTSGEQISSYRISTVTVQLCKV